MNEILTVGVVFALHSSSLWWHYGMYWWACSYKHRYKNPPVCGQLKGPELWDTEAVICCFCLGSQSIPLPFLVLVSPLWCKARCTLARPVRSGCRCRNRIDSRTHSWFALLLQDVQGCCLLDDTPMHHSPQRNHRWPAATCFKKMHAHFFCSSRGTVAPSNEWAAVPEQTQATQPALVWIESWSWSSGE